MDDDDLAMFEFIECRRLKDNIGIPLDDVTDEMRRQDSAYIYVCLFDFVCLALSEAEAEEEAEGANQHIEEELDDDNDVDFVWNRKRKTDDQAVDKVARHRTSVKSCKFSV